MVVEDWRLTSLRTGFCTFCGKPIPYRAILLQTSQYITITATAPWSVKLWTAVNVVRNLLWASALLFCRLVYTEVNCGNGGKSCAFLSDDGENDLRFTQRP